MEVALSAIQRPTLSKLWPVMLFLGVISLVKNSPTYIKQLIEYIKTRREEKILEEQEESDDSTEGK